MKTFNERVKLATNRDELNAILDDFELAIKAKLKKLDSLYILLVSDEIENDDYEDGICQNEPVILDNSGSREKGQLIGTFAEVYKNYKEMSAMFPNSEYKIYRLVEESV